MKDLLILVLRGAVIIAIGILIAFLMTTFVFVGKALVCLVIAAWFLFASLIVGAITEEPVNDLIDWLKGKFKCKS